MFILGSHVITVWYTGALVEFVGHPMFAFGGIVNIGIRYLESINRSQDQINNIDIVYLVWTGMNLSMDRVVCNCIYGLRLFGLNYNYSPYRLHNIIHPTA